MRLFTDMFNYLFIFINNSQCSNLKIWKIIQRIKNIIKINLLNIFKYRHINKDNGFDPILKLKCNVKCNECWESSHRAGAGIRARMSRKPLNPF